MMNFRIKSTLAGLLIFLSAIAHAELAQEFMLANGMKVIVKEDHRAPTAAHMIWYKLGAMDEINGATGVAHALEHMMFKGAKILKPGEFSKRVTAKAPAENSYVVLAFKAPTLRTLSSPSERDMSVKLLARVIAQPSFQKIF